MVPACLRIFMHSVFNKMKTSNGFILTTRRILTKMLAVFESSVKTRVGLHGKIFIVLFTSAFICK